LKDAIEEYPKKSAFLKEVDGELVCSCLHPIHEHKADPFITPQARTTRPFSSAFPGSPPTSMKRRRPKQAIMRQRMKDRNLLNAPRGKEGFYCCDICRLESKDEGDLSLVTLSPTV
jgi:hypothetical protein